MSTRAYSRCTSGHFFIGEFCPFDGWSSKCSKELSKAVKALEKAGKEISSGSLQQIGVSKNTIARTIIVQFGSDPLAFDAIAIDEFVIDGKAIGLHKVNEHFV